MPFGEEEKEGKGTGILWGGRVHAESFVFRVFKGWELRGSLRGRSQ